MNQFNIKQLLILTAMFAAMLTVVLQFNWHFIPAELTDSFQQGPLERKIIILIVCSLLPSFATGFLVWMVVRFPRLIKSYRELVSMRKFRRDEIRKLLEEQRQSSDYQSDEST